MNSFVNMILIKIFLNWKFQKKNFVKKIFQIKTLFLIVMKKVNVQQFNGVNIHSV